MSFADMKREKPFATINKLKAAWDRAQPLAALRHERLWQKFRLEWNYNSNHLEGNTLTYGETFLLLVHGKTSGSHDIREFEEMKAHDVAVDFVMSMAADKARRLTEADVRDLNRLLLKEPFYKPAVTPDGQPTRKRIIPGEYKSIPNNVLTATGELFQFTDPRDTPPAMAELMAWLARELKKPSQHPLETAAALHYRFVRIHPFDDGNGRTARLIMNYVLQREGYPPIVIKSADKSGYLAALQQADAGNLAAFVTYLERSLEWSLGLALKAAVGEGIEEPEDVDKEIAIFASRRKDSTRKVVRRSRELARALWTESLLPLMKNFAKRVETNFRPLFETVDVKLPNEARIESATDYTVMNLRIMLRGYRGMECEPFDVRWNLQIRLSDYSYTYTSWLGDWPPEQEVSSTGVFPNGPTADEEREITSEWLRDIWAKVRSRLPTPPSQKKTAAKPAKRAVSKRARR